MKHEAQKAHRKTAPRRRKNSRAQAPTKKAKKKNQAPEKALILPIKYDDIGDPLDDGRMIQYWDANPVIKLFPKFRSGDKPLPKTFLFWDHRYLLRYFGLRGWEFGNWVTQEDRMNYVSALGIALYDMRSVLGFRAQDMGLVKKITLAIGARGQSTALAHFEPHTFAINLTRYKGKPGPKKVHYQPFLRALRNAPKPLRFYKTGGVGSFAHEYGHALDYFFGGFVDQHPESFALSGGRSVRTFPHPQLLQQSGLRGQMERILTAIIWKEPGKKGTPPQQTAFYSYLRAELHRQKVKSEYFYRRNELFARVFEQYIGFKLERKKLLNAFLHKSKYESFVYLPQAHLKRIVPLIDQLVKQMRLTLKS